MSRLALGIDPGPTNCGWAILDMGGRKPSWVDGGVCTPAEVTDVLDRFDGTASPATCICAVEVPVAVHKPEAMVQVVQTAVCAGALIERCCQRGYRVVQTSPAAWQTALIGRPQKGQNRDKIVEIELRCRLEVLPRTNGHARDAAGIALHGWALASRSNTNGADALMSVFGLRRA